MNSLKFQSDIDKASFAMEERLVTFDEAINTTPEELDLIFDENINEAATKTRRRRKKRVRDHARSRMMKKLWKSKRKNFEKGIKKFHKSVKGKKLHKKVARNRAMGKYRNIHESMTTISSLLTHLALQTQYTSTINEEVESELLLEVGTELLTPVLESMSKNIDKENFTLKDLVECKLAEESQEFIDDIVLCLDSEGNEIEEPEILPECTKKTTPEEIQEGKKDDKSEKKKGNIIEGTPSRKSSITGEEITGDYDDNEMTQEEINKTAAPLIEKLKGNNDNEYKGDDVQEPKDTSNSVEESTQSTVDSNLFDINEDYQVDISGDQFEIIDESAGDPDVDGKYVIAKCRGPAFFPGSVSANNVEYTSTLWNTALNKPEFVKELDARRIYGTIGHDQVINDKAIREGMIGHIVSNMWIDSSTGKGMADYLILNSLPGKTTLTLLGAKSKFRVSTRCRGKFKSRNNIRGHKEPDPNYFFIRGIDFVHNPGFSETGVTLL